VNGWTYSSQKQSRIFQEYPMSEQLTVADYIVRRLAREGITDCFGVAGDFAFKLCEG
jgi:hypothetical protein